LKPYSKLLLFVLAILFHLNGQAQDNNFQPGKKYTLGEVSVKGNTNFNRQTIVTYSGLKSGDEITIPGEKISEAIKKLWKSNLFSDIDIYLLRVEGNTAFLEIRLSDLPELNEVIIKGIKERSKEEIIKDNKLRKGQKVTENLITTTRNYLTKKYQKEGYFKAKIDISTTEVKDSIQKARVNMLININKGKKVKIDEIVFNGNDKIDAKKLRKAMKNTKQKNPIRILKRSKFIDADYQEDLVSIVDKYKENGYRDARILKDTIIINNDETISLNIELEEGEKYTFGNITFVGNSVYTDQQLSNVLRIEKGDTYNGVLLDKRIADASKPDAQDLTNLYQNNGYLFSQINPVEVSADGNVIDMEIRITEGKPAYFNNVTVVGNETTNDHVIYRELRTRPGQLYSKENVVRTIRELSQLGFFDPEQIEPNFKNPNPTDGTLDMEYKVVERGSSQIELQGGYGGGGFIGTLGLSFNNFAIKDIFNKKAYKPVPRGDGQSLSLRLQASQFFQTYSFSFSEPWMGGKKPVQFSVSLSHTKQFLFDFVNRRANRNQSFNITGITLGLAKRLTVPDDYFTLSQALAFQRYDLNNYNTGLFTFGDGYSNNIAYTFGLSRNSSGPNPIYPMVGSNFSFTAKLSLPYSLFDDVDYAKLSEEREIALENNDREELARIDQERFNFLEFYKVKFRGDWYARVVDKLVLRPSVEFGFLGAYNNDRGIIPFERFFVGGDGLANFALDGREVIALRGYPNQSLTPLDTETGTQEGATVYNKFSLELRYPITLSQSASIYALTFLEGGASFNNFRDFNPFNIRRSAGAGVRIFMPAFGLLGIDFGYGFDSLPNAAGIDQPNGWETHFIIGQQF
jgi:outer membrane protein insertion porin family